MYQFISIPKNASVAIHNILTPGETPNNHKAAHKFEDKSNLFAVVRDPLERFVSWYEYHKHNQFKTPYNVLDFRRWMMMGCPVHWEAGLCKKLGITSPLRQKEFITDPQTGELLTQFVLRYDYLKADMRREMGESYAQKLKVMNRTAKKNPLDSYYDKEILEAVKYYFSTELDFYKQIKKQIHENILTENRTGSDPVSF